MALLIALVLAAPAQAQEDVGLLTALGRATLPSTPAGQAALPNGTVLFGADDGIHGRELWITDGTAAGTRLLADIAEGPAGSWPGQPEVVHGVAYFAAAGALWRSDGTAAGTREVADLQASGSISAARATEPQRTTFQPLGNEVAFVYYRAGVQTLMVTAPDGIRALDVFPEGETTSMELYASTGSELFVSRNHLLYRTDGTPAGTKRIDLNMGVGHLVTVGGYAVLAGPSSTGPGYVIGSIAPGATRSTHVAQASGTDETSVLRELDGAAYFGNDSGLHRWTPSGVTQLSTAKPTSIQIYSYGAFDIEKAGDSIYWAVREANGFARLYRYHGGQSGPVPGTAHAPTFITEIAPDRVLFYAGDDREPQGGVALWVADAAGARRLTEPVVNGGPWPITPALHGAVYRGALTGELHRTDGTTAGLLLDINKRPYGSAPIRAARVGGRVVFTTMEYGGLWVTDGTAAGTTTLRDRLGTNQIASDGTTAYFVAADSSLYQTDGTSAGTREIANGFEPGSFMGVGRVGPAYVFGARPKDYDRAANELWRTDGTAAGTREIGDAYFGTYAWLAAANERTLLVTSPFSLMRTDGSTAHDVFIHTSYEAVAVPDGFLSTGATEEAGLELFRLDADGANPQLAADLYPGAGSSDVRVLRRAGNRVLFLAETPGAPTRWLSSDLGGASVEPLTALEGFPLGAAYSVGAYAYVTTAANDHALLYRTDGTNAGTVLLHRFRWGDDYPPDAFTEFAGTIWFAATDAEHGRELWRTDGTAAGTRLAADIVPGPVSSDPLDIVATDEFLFFTAFDLEHGAEPWRVRRAAPTPPAPDEPEPEPEPEPESESPPVTIAPLPSSEPTATVPPVTSRQSSRASVSIKVMRLRILRGKTRWRVTGRVSGTGCSGRVRIELGRGDRRLKAVTARVQRCRFDALLATTSRTPGRWIAVRTVPTRTLADARSRVVRVR